MNVPRGYERLLQAHAVAVARADIVPSIRQALVASDGTRTTLHGYASRARNARPLQGRATAYAVRLPQGRPVVIRHNRHGGMLAPLTGDRFLSPTRAPLELEISLALRERDIPTPEVLAYAVYPPGALFQRADVVTAEIPESRDLVSVLTQGAPEERADAWSAAARLIATLAAAGVRHHDLNAKNVLISPRGGYVLDVDRVTLDERPADALEANLARLSRSLRKLREQAGVPVADAEINALDAHARELAPR